MPSPPTHGPYPAAPMPIPIGQWPVLIVRRCGEAECPMIGHFKQRPSRPSSGKQTGMACHWAAIDHPASHSDHTKHQQNAPITTAVVMSIYPSVSRYPPYLQLAFELELDRNRCHAIILVLPPLVSSSLRSVENTSRPCPDMLDSSRPTRRLSSSTWHHIRNRDWNSKSADAQVSQPLYIQRRPTGTPLKISSALGWCVESHADEHPSFAGRRTFPRSLGDAPFGSAKVQNQRSIPLFNLQHQPKEISGHDRLGGRGLEYKPSWTSGHQIVTGFPLQELLITIAVPVNMAKAGPIAVSIVMTLPEMVICTSTSLRARTPP
ncbi:hypothetical protein CTheo_8026 [Ceratobasidium theobromae]|uniref:Uncharacterized protein n=1 Tax=Ceratobasidium theobromae TaxID=1582974 RepID=A0A5N5QA44_9AGAM|nr:hypothetical protein CTheo_8026 [Ceratobasidium theobromae]